MVCFSASDKESYLLIISILLQYSNLYHQNEINKNLEKMKTEPQGSFRVRNPKERDKDAVDVMYSVIKKPKKSKSR